MVLLGIMGKKGSGKDTVSNYLVSHYGYKKMAFADPIKQIAQIIFDLDISQIDGNKKEIIDERWGITPREIFQKLGTEFGQYDLVNYFPALKQKNITRNFWVERLKMEYQKYNNQNVIISDVRFKHEIDAIKEMGGKIIKINRIIEKGIGEQHISEMEMNDIDDSIFEYSIDNNSSLEDLYQKINKLI